MLARPPQLPLPKHGRDIVGAVKHSMTDLVVQFAQGLAMRARRDCEAGERGREAGEEVGREAHVEWMEAWL